MKKLFQSLMLVMALAVVMPGMQSCKKYEEGPAFSLRTKKARLVNKWKVDKYEVNGQDATSLVSDYTYEFKKDGKLEISDGSSTQSGTWEFTDDKKGIVVNTGGDAETWTIMRLKNDELIFEYTDGDDNKHRAEFKSA